MPCFQVIVVFFCNCVMLLNGIDVQNILPTNPAIDSFSSYEMGLVKLYDSVTGEEMSPQSVLGLSLDKLTIQLTFSRLTFTIDLFLNRQLLSKNSMQKSVCRTGQQVERINQTHLMCYYIGNVRDIPGSVAAFSICRGIEGFFMTGNETFHVESVRERSKLRELTVVVYRGSDSTMPQGTCGVKGKEIEQKNDNLNRRRRRSNGHLHHTLSKRSAASFLWPQDLDGVVSVVELYLVNSFGQYAAQNKKIDNVIMRTMSIVNVVNSLYQPLNITFVVVGIEVWTDSDRISITTNSSATLDQFLAYRSSSITPQHRNDNAQLITDESFAGNVVGLAAVGTMCTYHSSAGINSDVNALAAYVGVSMAHEIGHNFGQMHDNPNQCQCKDPTGYCIMNAISNVNGLSSKWSQCSLDTFNKSFHQGLDICLHNVPNVLFSTNAACGNGVVEQGEQCDCGYFNQAECNTSCCDAKTCQLVGNATCASGRCCNINTCQITTGSLQCRQAVGPCDVPEYCDGVSPLCPADVFAYNGTACQAANVSAFCYNGQCRSHLSSCQLLWGPNSLVSIAQCYTVLNVGGKVGGNCGWNPVNDSYYTCNVSDVSCGKLLCSASTNLLDYVATYQVRYSTKTELSVAGQRYQCYGVAFDFGADVPDPGFVPNGASCGTNKMCVNRKCVDVSTIFTTTCTRSSCNNHGICNSLGQCHCDPGYSPPNCDRSGCGGSLYSSPAGCNNTAITTTTTVSAASVSSALSAVTALSPNSTNLTLSTTTLSSAATQTTSFNRLSLAVGVIIASNACLRGVRPGALIFER